MSTITAVAAGPLESARMLETVGTLPAVRAGTVWFEGGELEGGEVEGGEVDVEVEWEGAEPPILGKWIDLDLEDKRVGDFFRVEELESWEWITVGDSVELSG